MVADANWPRRIGFNALLAPEPQVPACVPVFYYHVIQEWQMLDLEPVQIARREAVCHPTVGQPAGPSAQLNNAR